MNSSLGIPDTASLPPFSGLSTVSMLFTSSVPFFVIPCAKLGRLYLFQFAPSIQIGVRGQVVPHQRGTVVLGPEPGEPQEEEVDDEELGQEVEAEAGGQLSGRKEESQRKREP